MEIFLRLRPRDPSLSSAYISPSRNWFISANGKAKNGVSLSLVFGEIEAAEFWVVVILFSGWYVSNASPRHNPSEYVGRKRVLLLSGLPLASSWVFNICATSVTWLYLSRFCSGIGSGMLWPAMSLYLGEVADPAIRGSLVI